VKGAAVESVELDGHVVAVVKIGCAESIVAVEIVEQNIEIA